MKCPAVTRRSWPWIAGAAILWLAIVVSVQFPLSWHPIERLYVGLQSGTFGVWWWAPADRPSLGFFAPVSIACDRHEPLCFRPFLWRDSWGAAGGVPLWIPAVVLSFIGARRYTVSSVVQASPALRRARRMALGRCALTLPVALAFAVSLAHRSEPLISTQRMELKLQNGGLVVERTETYQDWFAKQRRGAAASRIIFSGSPGEDSDARQSRFPFELLPDAWVNEPAWRISLPLWAPLMPLVIFTLLAVRKAHGRGPGLCRNCGYNLVGLDSVRNCPECGAVCHEQPATAPAV